MAYQVIARRWRPQSFDDMVFQEHISHTIRSSIENNRISHAYLFAGPRGVGKTTSARILAKSLNCVNGPTPNPCGVCDNCVEIKDGRSFDVIEIDGASNNSVDDVRDLREKVAFSPVKSRYKVYIIDEVHMLSGSAFNALLKTLEEPPDHAIFIFATTEIHKLPETILSRCQKYFFKKIPVEHVAAHLAKIVEGDGFTAEKGALYAIARAGEGSMRDAQSLLEQVLSFSTGNITEKDALSQLGVVSLQSFMRLFSSVADLNAGNVIDELETVSSAGADMLRYAAGVSEVIRAMRLMRSSVTLRESAGYSEEEFAALSEVSARFHDEDLSAFHKIITQCLSDIRYVPNERVSLEMAFLDMIAYKRRPSLAAILEKLDTVKTSVPGKAAPATTVAAPGVKTNAAPETVKTPPQSATAHNTNVAQPTAVRPPQNVQQSSAVQQNLDEEEPPLPDDETLASRTDYSEYDKDHPVVDKIREMFHGEVMKKGE